MKKILFLLFLSLGMVFSAQAQKLVVKNNLLYDLTTTPNLSLELGINKKSTFDLQVGLNPFEFANNSKFKHIFVQPEYRYWFCESFNGWFLGLHALGGRFNVGNIAPPFGLLPQLKDHRYEGWFGGGGLGLGYQWVLSKRWSLEAEIGAGYAYVDYDKYHCKTCGTRIEQASTNYWGVTKAAVSLVYVLR